MKKTVEYYMSLPYKVIISYEQESDDGYLVGTIKELPGLIIAADSIDELYGDLNDTKEIWFETNLELGREIKEPAELRFKESPARAIHSKGSFVSLGVLRKSLSSKNDFVSISASAIKDSSDGGNINWRKQTPLILVGQS